MCTQPLQFLNPIQQLQLSQSLYRVAMRPWKKYLISRHPEPHQVLDIAQQLPWVLVPSLLNLWGMARLVSPRLSLMSQRPAHLATPGLLPLAALIHKHHVQQAILQHPITLVPHVQQVANLYPIHWSGNSGGPSLPTRQPAHAAPLAQGGTVLGSVRFLQSMSAPGHPRPKTSRRSLRRPQA